MELGERLYNLRKERKITLKDAAQKCGCSFQHLQRIEKGIAVRPKIDLLYKLAAFYQFPSDILIIEAGKVPRDIYHEIIKRPQLLQEIRNSKI